jgi:hypothetical protein
MPTALQFDANRLNDERSVLSVGDLGASFTFSSVQAHALSPSEEHKNDESNDGDTDRERIKTGFLLGFAHRSAR